MKTFRGRGIRGILLVAASGTFVLAGAAGAQTAPSAEAPGAALRAQLSQLAANPSSVAELVQTGRAALSLGDGEGALGFFTRASELAPQDVRVIAGLASAYARTGRPETAMLLFAQASAAGAPEGEIAADRGLARDLLGQTAEAQRDYLLALRHREDGEVRRRLALSLAISGQREAALRLVEPQVRAGDRAGQRTRIMVLALSGDLNGANEAARASLPAQAAQAITPFLPRLAALSPGDKAAAANLGRVPGAGAVRTASVRTAQADPAALAFAGGGSSTLIGRLPIAPVDDDGVRRRPGGVAQVAGVAPARTTPVPTATMTTSLGAVAVRPARTQASSRLPVTRVAAARPPAARTAPAGTAQALVMPHPHEPLQLTDVASSTSTVQLASAAPASSSPAASTGTGGPIVRADELPAPVALAALHQPAMPQPDRANDDDEPTDGAAANLAVWNNGASAAPAPAYSPPARIPAATAQRPVSRPAPVMTSPAPRPTPVVASPAEEPRRGFSDVVATVSSLNGEPGGASAPAARPAAPRPTTPRLAAPTRTSPQSPATTRATPQVTAPATTGRNARGAAATRTATTTGAAATTRATTRAANTPRVWVQLGVSSNRAGFNYEITRMRRLAPELRTQNPHTAQIGSGNHRLLVGPFPNEAAARTLMNTLREKNIQSMTWTSPAGTEVSRLTGQ